MKKNIYFIVISLIISGLMMISCKKEKYTIEATAGDGGTVRPSGIIEVANNANLTIYINPNVGFDVDFVKVDGNITNQIDYAYTFENVVSNHKLEVTFKKTLTWYLTNGEWKLDSIYIEEEDGHWTKWKLWGIPNQVQERITFLANGKTIIYQDDKLVGDSPWSINENVNPPTFQYSEGLQIVIIEKLDDYKFIYAGDAPLLNDPNIRRTVKYVYIH